MSTTTNRAITNWFPCRGTARAVGFAFSGQMSGSAIAAPAERARFRSALACSR